MLQICNMNFGTSCMECMVLKFYGLVLEVFDHCVRRFLEVLTHRLGCFLIVWHIVFRSPLEFLNALRRAILKVSDALCRLVLKFLTHCVGIRS